MTPGLSLDDALQRLPRLGRPLEVTELPGGLTNHNYRVRTATHDLVGANGLPECYIRPIAFYGYGELGVSTAGNPVDTVIMTHLHYDHTGHTEAFPNAKFLLQAEEMTHVTGPYMENPFFRHA